MNNKKITSFLIFTFFLVIFYLFIYRKLLNIPVFVYADLTPFHSLKEAFNLFISKWGPHNFGAPITAMPYHIIFSVISLFFGGNINLFQRIFWFSLQPIAGISMFFFLRKQGIVKSETVIWLTSFVYSFNPISIFMFAMGAAPALFLYAFQPILFYFLLKFFREDTQKKAFTRIVFPFTIVLALISSYARDALIIESIIFFISFLVFLIIKQKKRNVIKGLGFYFFSLIIAILLFSFYFFFLFSSFIGFSKVLAPTFLVSDNPMQLSIASWFDFIKKTYSSNYLSNIFAFSGSHLGWFDSIYPNKFFPFIYLIPILSFFPLLFSRKKNKSIIVLLSTLSLAILGFIWLTHLGKSGIFFRFIRPLLVFRESYKVLSLLPLVFIPLLAISLEAILNAFKKIKTRPVRIFLNVLLISIILSSIILPVKSFAFAGDGGLLKVNEARYSSVIEDNDLKNISIPVAYYRLGEWLNQKRQEEGIFRTAWFPIDRHILNKLQQIDEEILFDFSRDPNPTTIGSFYYTRNIFDNIISRDLRNLNKWLGLANIKYLIVYENSRWLGNLRKGWAETGVVGSPRLIIEALNGANLEEVMEDEDFKIYKTGDESFLPRIYSPSWLIYLDGEIGQINDINFNRNIPAIFFPDFLEGTNFKNIIQGVDEIFISPSTSKKKLEETNNKIIEAYRNDNQQLIERYFRERNFYKSIVFLDDDYSIIIPRTDIYQIFLKKSSVLANDNNTTIWIGDKEMGISGAFLSNTGQGWLLAAETDLSQGTYPFKIYSNNQRITTINFGDLILKSEGKEKNYDLSMLEFRKINSTKYKIRIYEAKSNFPLVFSESFHSGWKAYLVNNTIQNNNLSKGHIWDTWFKKPLDENNHLMVNGYANSWIIDPKEVCNNSEIATSPTTPRNDKAVCIKNPDGTYDMELVVEFWPQRLFYLGVAISLSTLIGCLIYLGYDWRKNRSLTVKKTLLKPIV